MSKKQLSGQNSEDLIKIMENETFDKSIAWILKEFGSIKDLPEIVIPVIWVAVYRAMEAGKAYELGIALLEPRDLKKDKLSQSIAMLSRVQKSTLTLEFIKKMVPIIRESKIQKIRMADSQLLVDILKWNIIDAGSMSGWMRYITRLTTQADTMYRKKVPAEILQ